DAEFMSRLGSFKESFFTVCSRSGLHKLFQFKLGFFLAKFKKQRNGNAGLDPERTLVDVDPTLAHQILCSASSLDFDDPLAKCSLNISVGGMDNREIRMAPSARKNSFIIRLKCGLKHFVIRLASRAKNLSKRVLILHRVVLLWEIIKLSCGLTKITLGITKYCLISLISVTGVCLLVYNLVEAMVSILAISKAVKYGLDLVLVLIAAPWLLTFEIVSWMLSLT
ncbi:hypothetical protein B0H11DRAFT_2051514, partial [Mycena galericulata]